MKPCSTPEKFWNRVKIINKDECWLWQGAKHKKGYGLVGYQKKSYTANRLAYILTYGPITDDILVCHKCDNPPCCNPNHLFLGSNTDNILDSVHKGRHKNPTYVGEDHPGAKVTNEQVREIKRLNLQNISNKEIAIKMGVSLTIIKNITSGKTWKHIT